MKESLVLTIIALPVFLLFLLIIHLGELDKRNIGKYTTAYRCKKCNHVYIYDNNICEECGYKSNWTMKEEIGKWESCITKSGIVYKWEPKEDIVTIDITSNFRSNDERIGIRHK